MISQQVFFRVSVQMLLLALCSLVVHEWEDRAALRQRSVFPVTSDSGIAIRVIVRLTGQNADNK